VRAKVSTISILLIVLLIWAVVATTLAAYFYNEYTTMERLYKSLKGKVVVINIGIDYGNGTLQWFNGTVLPVGSTVLSALISVSRVEYVYGPYGAYVVSINGVREKIVSKSEGHSWIWYLYNATTGKLEYGPVAADKYILSSGQIIVWKYTHWKF